MSVRMTMSNNKLKYSRSGWFTRVLEAIRSKWKLADEVHELKHRLKLRDERISDMAEQIEAHREVLDAMRNDYRLLGMSSQADLDRLMAKPKPGQHVER